MIFDSIIDSLLLLTNVCFKVLLSLIIFFFFFFDSGNDKNTTKTIHETPKFSHCFFYESFKIS